MNLNIYKTYIKHKYQTDRWDLLLDFPLCRQKWEVILVETGHLKQYIQISNYDTQEIKKVECSFGEYVKYFFYRLVSLADYNFHILRVRTTATLRKALE